MRELLDVNQSITALQAEVRDLQTKLGRIGQVKAASDAAYSTFRGVLVRDASQTIPHNTVTVLQFDTIETETDPDGLLTPTTGVGAGWTVNRNGWYQITASVRFAANGTGSRLIGLRRNGGTNYLVQSRAAGSSDGAANISVAAPAELVSGDFIDAVVLQHSGVNLAVEQVHRTVHLSIAGRG